MSRISFNERRLLNRCESWKTASGYSASCASCVRAGGGEDIRAVSGQGTRRAAGTGRRRIRENEPAELEHTLTQHRQQAEREKFQRLQADAAMAGIVISREGRKSCTKAFSGSWTAAEEVRQGLAAAGAARAGGTWRN